MDIIDQANDLIEREMRARLAQRRNDALPPTGECFNCEEPLDGDRRWCDLDCRSDWERRQARR